VRDFSPPDALAHVFLGYDFSAHGALCRFTTFRKVTIVGAKITISRCTLFWCTIAHIFPVVDASDARPKAPQNMR